MGQRGIDGRYIGGELQRMPPKDRRRKLALVIASCNGNVRRTAHFLGMHRTHLYRLIREHGLYPVVNEARKADLKARAHKRRLKAHGISYD